MNPDNSLTTPTPPAKKPTQGRVFDVSRPGRTAAAPTSRPGVMGHKPQAQRAQITVSGIGESDPLLPPHKKFDIKPVASAAPAPAAPIAPQAQEPQGAPPVPKMIGEAIEQTKEPEQQKQTVLTAPVKADEKATESSTTPQFIENNGTPADSEVWPAIPAAKTDTGSTQTPAPSPLPPSTSQTKPAAWDHDDDVLHDMAAPLLEDGNEMVVSHHKTASPIKILLLLLLIVVLAAVAVDILLDAGILSIGGMPHTNFL